MLRVRLSLQEVHRSEAVYIVPRTTGPHAGTAVIGATLEDAGFDTATSPSALAGLRRLAAGLVPAAHGAAQIEAWAGLRPATADGLPLIGALPESTQQIVATGHFRNGILLAPATAATVAALVQGIRPPVDLTAYAPARFALASTAQ
jgi:glycine oxidase